MDLLISAIERQTLGAVAVSGVVLAIVYSIFWLRKRYSFFSDRNIGCPRIVPVIGHLHRVFGSDLGVETNKLVKEHGKVFGLYFGMAPRLIIADADLISQICIKDFDAFTDHYGSELLTKYQEHFLFLQKGHAWRRNRIFVSPTFTSGKIRHMYKLLESCARDLSQLLREQVEAADNKTANGGVIINGKELFSMYTMDAIARCCYGLNLERAKGVHDVKGAGARNEFVAMCDKMFKTSIVRKIPEMLLPTSLLKALGFTVTPKSTFDPVVRIVKKMLQLRKYSSKNGNQNTKYHDYLQMLVDAKIDDQMELDDLDSAENHHANLTHESLEKDQNEMIRKVKSTNTTDGTISLAESKLSEIEILSNAMFLLFVGLETTASLLSSCIYALAFHYEIQAKLFDEIEQIAQYDNGNNLTFDYDALTTCKYLDAVISETLRYSPVAVMVDRLAGRDYHFEKYNFTIPKGTVLFLAIHALHHNPEYWHEPAKFNPERFMPGEREKIIPGSYIPFGQGPRYCVGMRFSLTEAKLALARVIMEYRFEPAPGLRFPGARPNGGSATSLKDPRVQLHLRNKIC